MTKFFTVEVEMENYTTKNPQEIGRILRHVADQVDEHGDGVLKPFHSRSIMDVNGDTVGAWNIEERK